VHNIEDNTAEKVEIAVHRRGVSPDNTPTRSTPSRTAR
jgi:hypothetical protein